MRAYMSDKSYRPSGYSARYLGSKATREARAILTETEDFAVTETLATLARDILQSDGYDELLDCATAAKALRDALLYFVAPADELHRARIAVNSEREADRLAGEAEAALRSVPRRGDDYPGIARALDDYGAALLSQALVNSEREADRLAGEAEAALRRTTVR
jgi:hypothetical protein